MNKPFAVTESSPTPAEYGDEAAAAVCNLAREGKLAEAYIPGSSSSRYLARGVYAVAWPIVFEQLTRPIERRRGHFACAENIYKLEPDCHDRFQDDVEAVVTDVFRHADTPIRSLPGWISARLTAVTVDRNRRARGARGAQQRPRLPAWLGFELKNDPWLADLALRILAWVGVPSTAGLDTWPVDAWVEQRRLTYGDQQANHSTVLCDIDTVLKAMRKQPRWFEDYVERPLGRKQVPVSPDPDIGIPMIPMVSDDEINEAKLLSLAEQALTTIENRIRQGEPPAAVVNGVIENIFDPDHLAGTDLDADHHSNRVAALLADSASRDRITAEVLSVLEPPQAQPALLGERYTNIQAGNQAGPVEVTSPADGFDEKHSVAQQRTKNPFPAPVPVAATTVEELVEGLKAVRNWAGRPSLREISRSSGNLLPSTTLHYMLSNHRKLPRRDLLMTLLTACGVDDPAQLHEWDLVWQRVAHNASKHRQDPSPTGRLAG